MTHPNSSSRFVLRAKLLLPDFETPCSGASLLTHPVTCVSNDLISMHTHCSQLPVFSNMSTDGSPS